MKLFKRILMILGDITLFNVMMLISFGLRFGQNIPSINLYAYLNIAAPVTFLYVVILYFYCLYSDSVRWTYVDLGYSAFKAVASHHILILGATFMLRQFAYPRSVFFYSWVLNFAALWIFRSALKFFQLRKLSKLKVLIAGCNSDGLRIKQDIEKYSSSKYQIVGFCDDQSSELIDQNLLLGDFSDIVNQAVKVEASLVIVAAGSIPAETILEIIFKCYSVGIQISILPNIYEILIGKTEIKEIAGIPLIHLEFAAQDPWTVFTRFVFDKLIALLGLMIYFFPLTFVIIYQKLTDPGPVFFHQERVGLNGKIFRIHKIRTMVVNAEKETGPTLAVGDDERITSLGKFLRKYHLDEVPQLINVLFNQMSIVGPRPEREYFVKQFIQQNPAYRLRFLLKPGVTGLAQIHGHYNTTVEDKLRYDLVYLNNISLLLDLKILLLTVYRIITGQKFTN